METKKARHSEAYLVWEPNNHGISRSDKSGYGRNKSTSRHYEKISPAMFNWDTEQIELPESPKPYEVSDQGPLTVGRFKSAIVKAGGICKHLILGFDDEGGFDSFILGRRLIALSGNLYVTGISFYDRAARGAEEIDFKKIGNKRVWEIDRNGGGESQINEALSSLPESGHVYLALTRPNVRSRLGRHFIIPAQSMSALCTVTYSEAGKGPARKYPDYVLDIWGVYENKRPSSED
jgi:hypothetical protein